MENKDLDRIYEEEIKKEFSIKIYPVKNDKNDTVWAAEIPELPGCIGAGDTPQEAITALEDAKISWIDIAVYDNKKIPEPKKEYDIDYSGKFTLRLPKILHKNLAEKAEEECVSLNQYLLYLISKRHYETSTSRITNVVQNEMKRVAFTQSIQNQQWVKQIYEGGEMFYGGLKCAN